jgi:hypothetical protein
MRTGRLITLVFLAALVLAGCGAKQMSDVEKVHETPIDVKAHFEEGTDFSQYRTWMWVPAIGQSETEAFNDPRFREVVGDAVRDEMFSKGYTQTDSNPDLVINGMVSKQAIDEKYIEDNFKGTYSPDYFASLPDGGNSRKKWQEGTLMIFIYDAAKGQVVWMGTAQTEVYKKPVEGYWQKRTKEIVKELFASLPSR